ncbi:fungal-specific transcription factor domain-containing protein [Bisporella sp. PMI_857]|nr:fungal-specific transcription factor domain-containing protein [Bisporella sp. PMI_857]
MSFKEGGRRTGALPCPSSIASLASETTTYDHDLGAKSAPVEPIGLTTIDTFQPDEEAESIQITSPTARTSPPVIVTSPRVDENPPTDSLAAIRQQLHRSAVPEFLLHLPTMLVEYYFSYVCQIFSSFDGTLNPFRSTVGKLWDGSAPIYYAIQSMAAAYLANHFPRMSPVGIQMQRETYRYLYQSQRGGLPSSENLDKTLLTVLLVGQTTAWHNPNDLGLVHLKTAKRLNRRRIEQQVSQGVRDIGTRARRQNEFFDQCIMYWDMLAGYVDDEVDELGFEETIDSTSPVTDPSSPSQETEQVFPHPWTGVAPKAQLLFAQVGRLIRRYRKADSQAITDALLTSQYLEEQLLAFEPPSVTKLVDAGDENTPVQQYITLAEAYRYAGLLELYRVFPSILHKRSPVFEFLPIQSPQSADEFLMSLALHIVSLLEKLPASSGTRCLQPIVLIVAAAELRFSSASTEDPLSPFMSAGSIFNSLTNREVDVATARRFIVTRLQEYQLSLPAKPVMKALELIKETWARSDLGQDVYWMDVMADMGLASIFG